MLLRDHPLMSRHGFRNWPPLWIWVEGSEDKSPKGEVGILKWVGLSVIDPPSRCYLYINLEESSYMGSLLFDDSAFCRYVALFLESYRNRPIAEIGSLELSRTL
jgi:hypothetical protein